MEHPGFVAGFYLALLFLVLGPVIFSAESRILSLAGTDLWGQFMSWREFGFSELKKGNLPLWNPHVYCGIPYFSGFQSALLYPPNWLHLVLPLPVALNGGILFHLWVGGMSAYSWLRWGRSLHPLAALMGGGLYLFCGPHYLHVAAGHLTNLCVMAWVPLVFLALDLWIRDGGRKGLILGSVVVALQILAGHPQYVFFTAVMAGIYNLLLSPCSVMGKLRALAGQAAFYLVGALLAAVQLVPGLLGSAEGARAGGMTFDQARIFSFPPENLLTLFVPTLFGGLGEVAYAGRWLFWEMVLFVTVTALFLALLAVKEKGRQTLPAVCFLMAALLLALGYYTPLYGWLHAHVPGFNLFRGQSKFILFAALALIWLAAQGLDALVANGHDCRRATGAWITGFGLVAVGAGGAAWFFRGEGGVEEMARLIGAIRSSGEVLAPALSNPDQFAIRAARASAGCFLVAILWAGFMVAAGLLRERRRLLAILLVGVALAESVYFASRHTPSFSMADFNQSFPVDYFRDKPAEDRIFFEMGNNISMFHRRHDIWGSDPALSKRYAAFITATQGYAAHDAGQTIVFRQIHSLYPMLRLKQVCYLNRQSMKLEVTELGETLPVAGMHYDHEIAESVASAIDRMMDGEWDYRRQLVLETDPKFIESGSRSVDLEKVEVTRVDSDTFRFVVECPRPGVLLVTENYSDGWRARNTKSNMSYEVMPANAIFMGIPLGAGRHEFVFEYVQRGLWLGLTLSIMGVLILFGVGWRSVPWKKQAHAA
jgi:hypothetical protein